MLVVLLVVLVGALMVGAVLGRLDVLHRTAVADVTIESREFQAGGGTKDRVPQGYHLRYAYRVGGESYTGAAFRPWRNVDAREPKVCYDPDHPSDHFLVDGGYRCGR